MAFIGYFIAEGNVYEQTIGLAFHKNELEYVKEVDAFYKKFLNREGTISETCENGIVIRISDKLFSNFLNNFIPTYSQNKKIPEILYKLPKEKIFILLKSYFNGDGCIQQNLNKISCKSISLELMHQIRDLLLEFGIVTSFRTWNDSIETHQPTYCLVFSRRAYYNLGLKLEWLGANNKFTEDNRERNQNYILDQENKTLYLPILSKEVQDKIELVDFTVEDDHSFVTINLNAKNSQMNLGKWRTQIETQVEKWKKDPNHIGIFPIPIGYQELGGNARMLLLTPELKFLEENIINSLGVPLEFIKGGASWTGSSISLRIVENHFLTYRELLMDFLNYFVMNRLNAFLKIPKVKLKFKKFKMNDDTETKQLAIELNTAGKISDYTLLSEMGHDPETEAEANKLMRESFTEEQIKSGELSAEAQGKALVIQARYQVRAQRAANDERVKLQAELFQEELIKENLGIPEDPLKLIDKYAMEVFYMDPKTQQQYLDEMAIRMPITYRLVLDRLNMYQAEMYNLPMIGQSMPNPAIPHEPNKKEVGTREGDKVKIRDKEKTKGATRGEA